MEAALISPFVILFFLFFIRLFEILLIHSEIESIINNIGYEWQIYSPAIDAIEEKIVSENDLVTIAKNISSAYMSERLLKNEIKASFIEGRIEDVSLYLSQRNSKEIEIVCTYRIPTWMDFFSEKGILLTGRFYSKPYTGYMREEKCEEYVYITKYSEVYHTFNNCRSLNVKIEKVNASNIKNKRNKDGAKYYECSKCKGKNSEIYYITEYGNRYHTDSSCYELKVAVYKVPLTEVKERRKCYFCK